MNFRVVRVVRTLSRVVPWVDTTSNATVIVDSSLCFFSTCLTGYFAYNITDQYFKEIHKIHQTPISLKIFPTMLSSILGFYSYPIMVFIYGFYGIYCCLNVYNAFVDKEIKELKSQQKEK